MANGQGVERTAEELDKAEEAVHSLINNIMFRVFDLGTLMINDGDRKRSLFRQEVGGACRNTEAAILASYKNNLLSLEKLVPYFLGIESARKSMTTDQFKELKDEYQSKDCILDDQLQDLANLMYEDMPNKLKSFMKMKYSIIKDEFTSHFSKTPYGE